MTLKCPNASRSAPQYRPRAGKLCVTGLLLLTACQHFPPGPETAAPLFDTSGPGWTLRQVQAVWTPRRGAPSIAGDLLIAQHPDGRVFLEFSKAALPLATTRLTAEAWSLEVPAQGKRFGGRPPVPARSAWLALASDVAGRPPSGSWRWSSPGSGRLRLEHTDRGEQLEVHMLPAPP